MSFGMRIALVLIILTNITVETLYMAKCLYLLYGKKFRFNWMLLVEIASGCFLLGIFYLNIFSHVLSVLVLCWYCISQFGFEKRKFITNMELLYVLMGGLQLGCWSAICIAYFLFMGDWPAETYEGNLLINTMSFFIVWFLFPYLKLDKFSKFLQQETILPQIILSLGFLCIMGMIVSRVVNFSYLQPEQYGIVLVSIVLLFSVMYMWHKSYYKAKEQELQLQMYNMYDEGFQTLISDIRKRQHDFQNHLNTIHSMHYTCRTYEELVEKQQVYVEAIQTENKYYKMLSIGNPIIIGFLYGKFLQADKKDIMVSYDIRIGDLQSRMPLHKMVEVIGNLFDNAVEAVENSGKEKTIYLEFIENPDTIVFKIKNENEYISQEEQIKMFKKGESSKGEHRGFGLSNVKQVCEQYKCELQVRNQKEYEKVYLEFKVTIASEKGNKNK